MVGMATGLVEILVVAFLLLVIVGLVVAVTLVAAAVSVVAILVVAILMVGGTGVLVGMLPEIMDWANPLNKPQSFWQVSGAAARAQALFGSWCQAGCEEEAQSRALGGLFTSVCSCSQEEMERPLPSLTEKQLKLAREFLRWTRQHPSLEIRQLGQAAAEVLRAWEAQEQERFARAEEVFWKQWIKLPAQEWDEVQQWRKQHIPALWKEALIRALEEAME